MIQFYNTIFYEPVFNLLIFLYNIIPGQSIAAAIICLTIIVKGLLWPLSAQMLRSQKAMQTLQPKIDALKLKHGKDKEALAKDMMVLYKEEKVNPLSSCFPLLIQIPFFLAIFQAFREGLASNGFDQVLYSFVANPGHLEVMMWGVIDLAKPSIPLAILAAGAQFIQTRMLVSKRPPQPVPKEGKDEDFSAIMTKQMQYMAPIMTLVIGFTLPGGLALYWLATTVLTVVQQFFMFKTKPELAMAEVVAVPPSAAQIAKMVEKPLEVESGMDQKKDI
jgi:YidC/Oxa1 family membrane protein insertase